MGVQHENRGLLLLFVSRSFLWTIPRIGVRCSLNPIPFRVQCEYKLPSDIQYAGLSLSWYRSSTFSDLLLTWLGLGGHQWRTSGGVPSGQGIWQWSVSGLRVRYHSAGRLDQQYTDWSGPGLTGVCMSPRQFISGSWLLRHQFRCRQQ